MSNGSHKNAGMAEGGSPQPNPCCTPAKTLYLLLPARLIAFGAAQIGVALLLWPGRGLGAAWQASILWWPVSVSLMNIATFALLIALLRRENLRYRDLIGFQRQHFKRDILVLAAALPVVLALAIGPNMALANLFLHSPEQAAAMLVQPLPRPVAWGLLFVLPISIALTELPFYFGYLMPRLAALKRPWVALLWPALFAAGQHITMPLIFDAGFLAWRLLMFIPFTLFLAIILRWWPRLLAGFMVMHGLLDLSLSLMLF